MTSEEVDENGNFNIIVGEGYGFEGRITATNSIASTADFKLTGRFYTVDDGATISDYWLSASFYVNMIQDIHG